MIFGFADWDGPAAGFQFTRLDGTGAWLATIGAWLGRLGLAGLLMGRIAVNLACNDVSNGHGVGFDITEMGQRLSLRILLQFAF